MPDMQMYHTAAILTRVVDWFLRSSDKLWVGLEKRLSPLNIRAIACIPPPNRPPKEDIPFLLRSVLMLLDKLQQSCGLIQLWGPLTPLFDNPTFPSGMGALYFLCWEEQDNTRMYQIVQGGALPSLRTLQMSRHGSQSLWLHYWQLRNFILTHGRLQIAGSSLTWFERLIMQTSPLEHPVSVLYKSLIADTYDDPLPFTSGWERDLETTFTDGDLTKIFTLTNKLSMSCIAQEKNYKLLTRWYRCPADIRKYDQSESGVCWRCQTEQGNIPHMVGVSFNQTLLGLDPGDLFPHHWG